MAQDNVAEAKTHPSEGIEAARNGDEVILARNERSAGFGRDLALATSPDFDAPLDDFEPYSP